MKLITGGGGQIGGVLAKVLRDRYGAGRVLVTDIREVEGGGLFELLDVTDGERLRHLAEKYGVTEVYHLASILSAKGERMPMRTWDVNMSGLLNVLNLAAEMGLRVFYPSSIAVFGKGIDLKKAPQDGPLLPETVYGISKVAGELWCNYYHKHKGVDVRGVRFPGIIGYETLPGGGTTDYAVEIYHAAVKGETFHCYISKDVKMPMMYMADAIRAIVELMEAPAEEIRIRQAYNIAAMSFSPQEIYESIRRVKPEFKIVYAPDFRDEIARAWPDDLDDSAAREDWHWRPEYDLEKMTSEMLKNLALRQPTE